MKFRECGLLILISILIVVGVGGFVSTKYLGPGNPIELEAEKIIQDETGVQVDFDKLEKANTTIEKANTTVEKTNTTTHITTSTSPVN